MDFNSIWLKVRTFISECIRVVKITKKPDKAEYKTIVKASAIGMAIIGALGFVTNMVKQLFFS